MQKCGLRTANLTGCKLRAFDPGDADLTEASFFGTPLAGVDLRHACIDRLVVEGRELAGAIVTEPEAAQLARLLGLVIR